MTINGNSRQFPEPPASAKREPVRPQSRPKRAPKYVLQHKIAKFLQYRLDGKKRLLTFAFTSPLKNLQKIFLGATGCKSGFLQSKAHLRLKKFFQNVWSVRQKCVILHSLNGRAPPGNPTPSKRSIPDLHKTKEKYKTKLQQLQQRS